MTTPEKQQVDEYIARRLDNLKPKEIEWLAAEAEALHSGDPHAKQRAMDLFREYMNLMTGQDFPEIGDWYVL